MQQNPTAQPQGKPIGSPKAARRRWFRLLRNLALVAVAYLVISHTWPRKPGLAKVSYEDWTAELAARRGAVVVVPVWASWCRNCIEILPSLVRMSQDYREKGVTFASLCLDDYKQPEDVEAAESIVATNAADFPHFLLEQDIAATLGALSLQDLPAVLVYDSSGKLRYRLVGDAWENEISLADVEDSIESLGLGTTEEHR